MATIIDVIGAALGGGTLSGLLTYLSSRKKSRLETEQVAQNMVSQLLETAKNEVQRVLGQNNLLRQEISENGAKIHALGGELLVLNRKHEECELGTYLLQKELESLRGFINEKQLALEKVRVHILDDNEIDTYLFKQRLGRISLLDVKTFNQVDLFMKEIAARPEILILDYHLGRGVTIESFLTQIMGQPDYSPKVVVVTGDETAQVRETMAKFNVWRFFLKTGPYINLVAKQILDYLETRMR